MDLLADALYTAAVSLVGEHYGISEIGLILSPFGVYSHQIKLLPYLF